MGNGRCDSPGYNAKHGTHTIIDSERGMITDFHIFHVDLTGTSANVKLGGLKYVLQRFDDNSVELLLWPPKDTSKFVAF